MGNLPQGKAKNLSLTLSIAQPSPALASFQLTRQDGGGGDQPMRGATAAWLVCFRMTLPGSAKPSRGRVNNNNMSGCGLQGPPCPGMLDSLDKVSSCGGRAICVPGAGPIPRCSALPPGLGWVVKAFCSCPAMGMGILTTQCFSTSLRHRHFSSVDIL